MVHIFGRHIFLAFLKRSLHKIPRRLQNMGQRIRYLLDEIWFIIYVRCLLLPYFATLHILVNDLYFHPTYTVRYLVIPDPQLVEICNTWVSGSLIFLRNCCSLSTVDN